MPIAADHAFAIVLAVLFPLRAVLFGYRRLTAADPSDLPRLRLWLYRQGIAIQWSLAAVAVALWIWQGRPWALLGLIPRFTWGLIGVGLGFVVLSLYIFAQRRQTLEDEEALQRVRRQMWRIERMMPRTHEELRWFDRLAVTAGICEELLYRGYLLWYLSAGLALIPAVVVASLIFGLGHAYQGPRGILTTTVIGGLMNGIYLVTGSLYPCMVIHAMTDLYAGQMAHAAFSRGEAATLPQRDPDPESGAAGLT